MAAQAAEELSACSEREPGFINGVAAKLDGDGLRHAQQEKDAVRAYELVYAALGA